jgi:hypothetical protein
MDSYGYTEDLADFGYRELHMAGVLLVAFKNTQDKTEYFTGEKVRIAFNANSGNVFLVDDDYNVAMMNGHALKDWFTCPYCGHEGFKEDMRHEPKNDTCTEYLKQIGID